MPSNIAQYRGTRWQKTPDRLALWGRRERGGFHAVPLVRDPHVAARQQRTLPHGLDPDAAVTDANRFRGLRFYRVQATPPDDGIPDSGFCIAPGLLLQAQVFRRAFFAAKMAGRSGQVALQPFLVPLAVTRCVPRNTPGIGWVFCGDTLAAS